MRLKQILKEKGITRTELANKVEVSTTSISNISNGRHMPKQSLLIKIAEALDVDIRDLFVSTKLDPETEELKEKIKQSRDGLNEALDLIGY